jgi:hypothetical protein
MGNYLMLFLYNGKMKIRKPQQKKLQSFQATMKHTSYQAQDAKEILLKNCVVMIILWLRIKLDFCNISQACAPNNGYQAPIVAIVHPLYYRA